MKPYNDDDAVAQYLIEFYPQLLTADEATAYKVGPFRDFEGHGNGELAITGMRFRDQATKDNVKALLRDGMKKFCLRTASRILDEHRNSIKVNRCPECNCVLLSPKAQQCFQCGQDWHVNS